jgi:uncharacterized protein (TIGR00255 family)
MTGFGKAICELENKKIVVEVKSLNSKQLDSYLRMPNVFKEKEIYVRNIISTKLIRGKVDFSMQIESADTGKTFVIDKRLVKSYYDELTGISKELGVGVDDDLLSIIMKMPDVFKSNEEEWSDDEWKSIEKSINEALDNLIEFRKQEGVTLEKDVKYHINNIQSLLKDVEPYEKVRIEKVKDRLRNNIKELISNNEYDKNRFEQELIFYLEKLDITEEKIRLAHHCNYFLKTMELNEPVGKKLGFISQEIGREINTLGSKANDSDMQKIVVIMKDELEKIKEQVLNIL